MVWAKFQKYWLFPLNGSNFSHILSLNKTMQCQLTSFFYIVGTGLIDGNTDVKWSWKN